MNKKILLGIIIGSLPLTSLAHAGWKEWAAGLSFGSIIPALAYAYHAKNAPLALGYTLGASLASLGLLLWADSQTVIFITDEESLEKNMQVIITAIEKRKTVKIILKTTETTAKQKTITIKRIKKDSLQYMYSENNLTITEHNIPEDDFIYEKVYDRILSALFGPNNLLSPTLDQNIRVQHNSIYHRVEGNENGTIETVFVWGKQN